MADKIAKQLGVTEIGLKVLARAVATGGRLERTGGTAAVKLAEQGFITMPDSSHGYLCQEITEAGREIVRRARAMGW